MNVVFPGPHQLNRLASCHGNLGCFYEVGWRAAPTKTATEVALMKAHVLGWNIGYARYQSGHCGRELDASPNIGVITLDPHDGINRLHR